MKKINVNKICSHFLIEGINRLKKKTIDFLLILTYNDLNTNWEVFALPLKNDWVTEGVRVITPDGFGVIDATEDKDPGYCLVRLDEKVAGNDNLHLGRGEVALDTPFTVARILSVDGMGHVIGAVNYPSRKEVKAVVEKTPFVQNETLIGFNFESWRYIANDSIFADYQILEMWLDMYSRLETKAFSVFDKARRAWVNTVEQIEGTSGNIYLAAFLEADRENYTKGRIHAYSLSSTMKKLRQGSRYL